METVRLALFMVTTSNFESASNFFNCKLNFVHKQRSDDSLSLIAFLNQLGKNVFKKHFWFLSSLKHF